MLSWGLVGVSTTLNHMKPHSILAKVLLGTEAELLQARDTEQS